MRHGSQCGFGHEHRSAFNRSDPATPTPDYGMHLALMLPMSRRRAHVRRLKPELQRHAAAEK